jgi:DNA-binding NarL/FixJ family response regulator
MLLRNTNEGTGVAGVDASRMASQTEGTIRVWLVDDSENFRVLLAALLEDEGGMTCVAQFSTAEEALSALESQTPPDVILLDLRMPGMGGLAAVRPIRERAPASHVLMLTTFGDLDSKARALRDGATDFLLKSYQVNEIACRVRSAAATTPRPITELAPAAAGNKWPTSRASGLNDRTDGIQNRLPVSGRRNTPGGGECASNRLMRGVQLLRAMLTNAIGRSHSTKSVEQLVGVETTT